MIYDPQKLVRYLPIFGGNKGHSYQKKIGIMIPNFCPHNHKKGYGGGFWRIISLTKNSIRRVQINVFLHYTRNIKLVDQG